MSKQIYRHADKAISSMFHEIEREFQNMSLRLRTNTPVYREVRAKVADMYERLYEICYSHYLEVAAAARKDAQNEIGTREKERPENHFVKAVLSAFSLLTHYSYRNEWNRKRDRLVESLMSSRNQQEMRQSLRRALNLLENQTRQYADIVTDEVRLDVFKSAKVKRVLWNTQHDGKVCSICLDRDGVIFDVNSIPTKHHRCRCYLTAQ